MGVVDCARLLRECGFEHTASQGWSTFAGKWLALDISVLLHMQLAHRAVDWVQEQIRGQHAWQSPVCQAIANGVVAYIQKMTSCGVRVVSVLDALVDVGGKRRETSKRSDARKAALAFCKEHTADEAGFERQAKKAVRITDALNRAVRAALAKTALMRVCAPGQADHQMVYLARHGYVDGVVSVDMDIAVMGVPLLIHHFKHGQLKYFLAEDYMPQWNEAVVAKLCTPVASSDSASNAATEHIAVSSGDKVCNVLMSLVKEHGRKALVLFAVAAGCDYFKLKHVGSATSIRTLAAIHNNGDQIDCTTLARYLARYLASGDDVEQLRERIVDAVHGFENGVVFDTSDGSGNVRMATLSGCTDVMSTARGELLGPWQPAMDALLARQVLCGARPAGRTFRALAHSTVEHTVPVLGPPDVNITTVNTVWNPTNSRAIALRPYMVDGAELPKQELSKCSPTELLEALKDSGVTCDSNASRSDLERLCKVNGVRVTMPLAKITRPVLLKFLSTRDSFKVTLPGVSVHEVRKVVAAKLKWEQKDGVPDVRDPSGMSAMRWLIQRSLINVAKYPQYDDDLKAPSKWTFDVNRIILNAARFPRAVIQKYFKSRGAARPDGNGYKVRLMDQANKRAEEVQSYNVLQIGIADDATKQWFRCKVPPSMTKMYAHTVTMCLAVAAVQGVSTVMDVLKVLCHPPCQGSDGGKCVHGASLMWLLSELPRDPSSVQPQSCTSKPEAWSKPGAGPAYASHMRAVVIPLQKREPYTEDAVAKHDHSARRSDGGRQRFKVVPPLLEPIVELAKHSSVQTLVAEMTPDELVRRQMEVEYEMQHIERAVKIAAMRGKRDRPGRGVSKASTRGPSRLPPIEHNRRTSLRPKTRSQTAHTRRRSNLPPLHGASVGADSHGMKLRSHGRLPPLQSGIGRGKKADVQHRRGPLTRSMAKQDSDDAEMKVDSDMAKQDSDDDTEMKVDSDEDEDDDQAGDDSDTEMEDDSEESDCELYKRVRQRVVDNSDAHIANSAKALHKRHKKHVRRRRRDPLSPGSLPVADPHLREKAPGRRRVQRVRVRHNDTPLPVYLRWRQILRCKTMTTSPNLEVLCWLNSCICVLAFLHPYRVEMKARGNEPRFATINAILSQYDAGIQSCLNGAPVAKSSRLFARASRQAWKMVQSYRYTNKYWIPPVLGRFNSFKEHALKCFEYPTGEVNADDKIRVFSACHIHLKTCSKCGSQYRTQYDADCMMVAAFPVAGPKELFQNTGNTCNRRGCNGVLQEQVRLKDHPRVLHFAHCSSQLPKGNWTPPTELTVDAVPRESGVCTPTADYTLVSAVVFTGAHFFAVIRLGSDACMVVDDLPQAHKRVKFYQRPMPPPSKRMRYAHLFYTRTSYWHPTFTPLRK